MKNRLRGLSGGVLASAMVSVFAQPIPQNGPPTPAGKWHCAFLVTKNAIEKHYYSVWTFDDQKRQVAIFFSPVHKGFTMSTRWQGDTLALGDGGDPFIPVHGIYKTQRPSISVLIIENPQLPWHGWRCQPSIGDDWPADGLQFLDYARYPWLAHLVEDGLEITKYRDPAQYREWRHSLETQK
ncbi:MAG: hypothetical protein WBQ05_07275 [Candidatus Competibacter denitrificans]